MNKTNTIISRITIALILAVLISNIARCQIVDNWQKNNASRDSINLSMDAKPLTYSLSYESKTAEIDLDEFYPIYKPDSVNIKFWSDTTLNGIMIKIEKLERELNFLGSEYQGLSIKIHELKIENDRLSHKLNNLINKQ